MWRTSALWPYHYLSAHMVVVARFPLPCLALPLLCLKACPTSPPPVVPSNQFCPPPPPFSSFVPPIHPYILSLPPSHLQLLSSTAIFRCLLSSLSPLLRHPSTFTPSHPLTECPSPLYIHPLSMFPARYPDSSRKWAWYRFGQFMSSVLVLALSASGKSPAFSPLRLVR